MQELSGGTIESCHSQDEGKVAGRIDNAMLGDGRSSSALWAVRCLGLEFPGETWHGGRVGE